MKSVKQYLSGLSTVARIVLIIAGTGVVGVPAYVVMGSQAIIAVDQSAQQGAFDAVDAILAGPPVCPHLISTGEKPCKDCHSSTDTIPATKSNVERSRCSTSACHPGGVPAFPVGKGGGE